MWILLALLLAEWVTRPASAALRPIQTDIHPDGGKAEAVYKSTPQGDLKIHLYFPPDWKAGDRRSAIVLYFGGSCAIGNPLQFAATAQYFAARGSSRPCPSTALKASITRVRNGASRTAKAASAGCV